MRIRRARFTFDGVTLSRDGARAIATLALRASARAVRRSAVAHGSSARLSVRIPRTAGATASTIAGRVARAVVDRRGRPDSED
jgi:hypothetical protein